MKKSITGIAAIVALTFTGLSAHASCSDPRASAQQAEFPLLTAFNFPQAQSTLADLSGKDAAEKIVGTWHVTYTANGATSPYAQAFIQWHQDRTEWENITMPTLSGNICMGSWKAVDSSHVSRNHVGWLFTQGIISGYFTETETVDVSSDGNSYKGHNDTTGFDMTGKQLFEVKGTAAAVRIAP